MRVEITHIEEREGFISKDMIQIMSFQVTFSEEQKAVIKKFKMEPMHVSEFLTPFADDPIVVRVSDLQSGFSLRYHNYEQCKDFTASLIADLTALKETIEANTSPPESKVVVEL